MAQIHRVPMKHEPQLVGVPRSKNDINPKFPLEELLDALHIPLKVRAGIRMIDRHDLR